jgi:23S rRNA pseudouridine955/2504/2580 synthase
MRAGKQPNASAVQYREIDADNAGQRVDNFLISKLKGIPKSHIYRILRKGEVRINRGRCPPDYRLKAGDVVRIPPVRLSTADDGCARSPSRPPELSILFEDDDLLAVDKPAKLAVHGGSGVAWGLIESLRVSRPRTRFLELVHRLDRDTSGCLLVAKRRSALLALHEQLRDAEIDKRYTALVRGRWADHVRKVEAPLLKFRLRSGERKVEVSQTGRDAATQFVPKCLYADSTQVEIRLLTGRTHQARVHAAHINYPIAGDTKYGDREFNRSLRRLGLNRLFLHAHSLTFRHPRDGGKLVIESTLPRELAMLLDSLDSTLPSDDSGA